MSELSEALFTEKYRPSTFEDLILDNKEIIINHIKNSKLMPSFLLCSNSPGTGKTSTAKIIANTIQADYLLLNSSDERGIDTIREKIKLFAQSLSTNINVKRCVICDEMDGMTKIAQDSLRNLIETYSDNCFFIFSCNDVSKVIEPIKSRCISINFGSPNKADIQQRLIDICEKEQIAYKEDDIDKLIQTYYPDIRSMILKIQESKIAGTPLLDFTDVEFRKFIDAIVNKDVTYIYEKVYSNFPVMEFNKYFFNFIYKNWKQFGLEKTAKISILLADIEKSWNLGANLPIIFISNIVEIMKLL